MAIRVPELGDYHLAAAGEPELLFCDNDTNVGRLFQQDVPGHFKDAFHDYLVGGRREAADPGGHGSKVGLHYAFTVPAGGSVAIQASVSPFGLTPFPTIVEPSLDIPVAPRIQPVRSSPKSLVKMSCRLVAKYGPWSNFKSVPKPRRATPCLFAQ